MENQTFVSSKGVGSFRRTTRRSARRTEKSAIFAVLRGGVFLVPAFIFLPQILGIEGIWLAMPLSEILTFAAIGVFYLLQNNSCTKKQP